MEPRQIETVKSRHPHEDLLFLDETLCLAYAEGVQLLTDSGWIEEDGSQPDPDKDLSTKGEQALGRLIREKYHTDYYILGSFDAAFWLNPRCTDCGYLV